MSVNAVTDADIRRLNRHYRGKNKVTDVLSFRLADGAPQPGGVAGEIEDLGDVFVCLPQVRRQAKAVGRFIKIEAALMVAHGTLHLLGYDHVTLAEETTMFGLQHEALMREAYI
jgi:probable rRNA maturation factor